jgi:hypothetical protein
MRFWRKGWDSNPRGSVNPLAVFKTAALNHSATLPNRQDQAVSDNPNGNGLATAAHKPVPSPGAQACCAWSARVFAPPIAHGTDDRAEVAPLRGEDVLGPRGTHRIKAPLDDAILLKRPQTLR